MKHPVFIILKRTSYNFLQSCFDSFSMNNIDVLVCNKFISITTEDGVKFMVRALHLFVVGDSLIQIRGGSTDEK